MRPERLIECSGIRTRREPQRFDLERAPAAGSFRKTNRCPLRRTFDSLSRMSRSVRAAAVVGLFAWLFGGLIHPQIVNASLQPPTSLRPIDEAVYVRLSHRHRAVRDCSLVLTPARCVGREVDGDTATTVRLSRAGAAGAALRTRRDDLQVSLPRHDGPQEQAFKLERGDWLVDWPGSARIARLHVAAGSSPEIALLTTTGSCELKANRCELDKSRKRRITIREASP